MFLCVTPEILFFMKTISNDILCDVLTHRGRDPCSPFGSSVQSFHTPAPLGHLSRAGTAAAPKLPLK